MSLLTNLQNTASDLLSGYGQQAVFIRWSNTEYNVATGGVDPVVSSTFSTYGHPSTYRFDEVDGVNIQYKDIKFLTYSATEPLIDDECTVDSQAYRVMNVEKLNVQGGVVAYRLQLRK